MKLRCLLVALSALLLVQSSSALSTTFRIDPTLAVRDKLPGLNGGEPRAIAVASGPLELLTEMVANEVVFHPNSEKELDAFLARYGGTILRDGVPFVPGPLPKDHPPIESDGWYLIRIDPALSPLDDLEKNLDAGPLVGEYRFSSEEAAQLVALLVREQGLSIGPNLVSRPQAIPEHPDDPAGYIDSSTFWWLNDQGISTSVIRAWDYLRYHGLPPQNGTWRPARIAIIDGGFALSQTGDGAPLDGNLDYGIGMTQVDILDQDLYAGGENTMTCGGHLCRFHGQQAFGVAAAEPGNHYGGAGTGGRVVWPLLVRVGSDDFTQSHGIRAASILGADVISVSLSSGCHVDLEWICSRVGFADIYSRMQNDVYFALSYGHVVVAAAGNKVIGDTPGDITATGLKPIPCKLDGVICVGGVDSAGNNVFNWGSPVDIWAPTGIKSTPTPESIGIDNNDIGRDEIAGFGGTSASTPFIAGVVGLMKALNPMITPQNVLLILQATANPSQDANVHRGWVDALRAVQVVRTNQPPVVQWLAPTSATTEWTGTAPKVEASDPEVSPANAWQWPMTVAFSSDVDGPLCTDSVPPYSCFSGPLTLGNHVLTARVTDAFGAATSITRSIQSINRPPAPDIGLPLATGTYFAHQPVRLEAYVPDPDESIPQNGVEWSSDRDGVLGTGWSRDQMLTEGVHVISVLATDAHGATGEDSVTITVQSGAGLPSVQILPPSPDSAVTPGTVITLQGVATDPEDGPLTGSSLVWSSDIDGPLGTGQSINVVLSGPAIPCNPEIVTHTIRLRATDSDGQSVEVTITITVGLIC